MKKTPEHPRQAFAVVGQVVRFRRNAIVDRLLDEARAGRKVDLNDIACWDVSDADRRQFAQLIGYSVAGYGDLSYVGAARARRADAAAGRFMSRRGQKDKLDS